MVVKRSATASRFPTLGTLRRICLALLLLAVLALVLSVARMAPPGTLEIPAPPVGAVDRKDPPRGPHP